MEDWERVVIFVGVMGGHDFVGEVGDEQLFALITGMDSERIKLAFAAARERGMIAQALA